MIVVSACKAVAVVIVGSLAFHSGRNIIQTRQICDADTHSPLITSGPTTVNDLQRMKRAELLQLFIHQCEAPKDLEEVEGQWDGALLKNNGLTQVTRFITNRMFGKGREWNGKRLDTSSCKGMNRFERFSVVHDPKQTKTRSTVILATEEDRPFLFGISASGLDRTKLSVILDYNNDENPIIWRGMKDEIRVVPSTQGRILLGMGSIRWSGGKWNAAPFCLYKKGTGKRL